MRAYANKGRTLEDLLRNSLEGANGTAVLKVPTSWVPKREGGQITSAHPVWASIDFIGVIHGRPVAFDAKEVSDGRFAWDLVPEKQVQFLRRFAASGGTSFLAIAWWREGFLSIAPLASWDDRWRHAQLRNAPRGAKSVAVAEAKALWPSMPLSRVHLMWREIDVLLASTPSLPRSEADVAGARP